MTSRGHSKPARARREPRPIRLRVSHEPKLGRFLREVVAQTSLLNIVYLLVLLWMLFAAGVYLAERGAPDASIRSYGAALYWGVAAFSTAGIADTPVTGTARLIGGIWIVVGSTIFFGTIVATVTGYFMRPLQRPARQIVDTIEYNLEHLADLSLEELDLLKRTTDNLITHMESLKIREESAALPGEDDVEESG